MRFASVSYFNSTMVRLDCIFELWIEKPLNNFNSTMVRLDYQAPGLGYSCPGNFNSTMVRLDSIFVLLLTSCRSYFNSTMVRLDFKRCFVFGFHFYAFQFHFGTIRLNLESRHIVYVGGNFNSTLVRLDCCLPPNTRQQNTISIPLWYD